MRMELCHTVEFICRSRHHMRLPIELAYTIFRNPRHLLLMTSKKQTGIHFEELPRVLEIQMGEISQII